MRAIAGFQAGVLRLAGTFSKIEINTERLKHGRAVVSPRGKFREADASEGGGTKS